MSMIKHVCYVEKMKLWLIYFFECVVAQRVWSEVSDFLGLDIGENFELVAKLLFLAIVSG